MLTDSTGCVQRHYAQRLTGGALVGVAGVSVSKCSCAGAVSIAKMCVCIHCFFRKQDLWRCLLTRMSASERPPCQSSFWGLFNLPQGQRKIK